ncbi:sensor histidine kinase [Clostridium frigidicarnis]|uniref:histidine kinase n=1 Tax=Clostridium frigidicarnis TaxID=84698 RepID=A0A1I0WF73_9CLOT|nr:HAMP domain-containing sensor histidine kinase [Clostridium frigidicarnis]SFA87057.1 Signal transduction histidine kinase [Clostridium frigidicarnis]
MDTKSKSDEKKLFKFSKILSPFILIFPLILLLLLYGFISSLHRTYNTIQNTTSSLDDMTRQLSSIEDGNDNLSISYDLWIKEFATNTNIDIYKNFNDLSLLSQKSQSELNDLSKKFSSNNEDFLYNNLVKYIIIDKSSKTFITNDFENISSISQNINSYSIENGNLFNYIHSMAQWYYITYDSRTSPTAKYSTYSIMNANNYVEAYWLPKEYKLTDESKPILSKLLDDTSNNIKKSISVNESFLNSKKDSLRFLIIVAVILGLLFIANIFIIYKIGIRNLINNLKSSYIFRSFKAIKLSFQKRSTLFKLTLFIISMCANFSIILILYIGYGYRYIPSPLALLSLIVILFNFISVIPDFIKFCKYLDLIIKGADKITSGNLDYMIEEKGDKKLLSLAENINKINKGFKVSIEEQIKNEKMKSELVANVSHDLKTPLTSIINYTDILLRDDITEEKQTEYLNILNKKSLKLKTLIEDLFEVSKINSGKVDLNKTNVDIVELLNQSIAEYSDTEIYSSKNLTFLLKSFEPIIEMNLDGNRMSRVFENLINNTLKYSLKDSRVFVEIEPSKNGIKIFFKNTSSIHLDFDKEEIFERFSRGDKSRNSNIEGNGLGLAIAKSIVELHGGIMYIDFDGDLFKAIIELHY